jgi:hypothetical protein
MVLLGVCAFVDYGGNGLKVRASLRKREGTDLKVRKSFWRKSCDRASMRKRVAAFRAAQAWIT